MAKFKPHFWFLGIMIVYFFIRYLRLNVEGLPAFIKFYATDVLFVPAMTCFALIFTRILKRNNKLLIPIYMIFIQTAVISVYFEWYLPTFKSKPGWYTSDWVDVIMYFLGAIAYIAIQQYSLKSTK